MSNNVYTLYNAVRQTVWHLLWFWCNVRYQQRKSYYNNNGLVRHKYTYIHCSIIVVWILFNTIIWQRMYEIHVFSFRCSLSTRHLFFKIFFAELCLQKKKIIVMIIIVTIIKKQFLNFYRKQWTFSLSPPSGR